MRIDDLTLHFVEDLRKSAALEDDRVVSSRMKKDRTIMSVTA